MISWSERYLCDLGYPIAPLQDTEKGKIERGNSWRREKKIQRRGERERERGGRGEGEEEGRERERERGRERLERGLHM